jgi:hypothetical protein
MGKASLKLDEIALYSRSVFETDKTYPIKRVQFGYNYALCDGSPGVPNSSTGGKLTLTDLKFDYGKGEKGQFNPYQFTYDNNPAYKANEYDRWGVYKPNTSGDSRRNIDFPYSDQDLDNATGHKAEIDNYAAAWSLTQIQTPSGGKIIIDYETDDYGYVQHKQAMQMQPILDGSNAAATETTLSTLNADHSKIRFKLQHPVKTSDVSGPGDYAKFVRPYLDMVRKQLFFKILINLHTASEDDIREYVSGYVDIVDDDDTMTLERIGGSGDYVYGTFRIMNEIYQTGGGTNVDVPVHPFTMRAWQHIRTNQPALARADWSVTPTTDAGEKLGQILALKSMIGSVRQMLAGFYTYCDIQNWGKEIATTKSWIRLNTVDKIKYGGGLRVKQITLNDNWGKDKDGIYGQVYDYTIEENGAVISSGVASYEPLIGGEENSLRYGKKYPDNSFLRSENNLFFEFPVNESYYPGPQVGYRKVTVTSLAASALDKHDNRDPDHVTITDEGVSKSIFPTDSDPKITYGTTGKTVHEFYTAKDFPVLTDETDKINARTRMSIPIPFMGNLSVSKLTASQGYSIITNDMHGKPRQVSTYRQTSRGDWEPDPISWVRYNYAVEPKVYQNEVVQALSSDFVINTDSTLSRQAFTDNPTGEPYTIGQENEFFIDMRQFQDDTWEGGASGNLDLVYLPIFAPIPVPTIWPSIGKSKTQLRTAVTNKIMFRPGILESTEASDGGSVVKNQNLKWDKLTGQVVLSTTTNNFDQPIYSYTIPGHTQYRALGGAYKNAGLTLKIVKFFAVTGKPNDYTFTSDAELSALYPGDEMIVYFEGTPKVRAIYMGDQGGVKTISTTATADLTVAGTYTALIIRSGFRNQLNASAGSITALSDPTKPVPNSTINHQKKVFTPNP